MHIHNHIVWILLLISEVTDDEAKWYELIVDHVTPQCSSKERHYQPVVPVREKYLDGH